MKRKILPILSLMAAMTLVACGGNADKSAAKTSKGTTTKSTAPTSRHTHTYATEWSYDENQHWHAATCHDGESCATAKGSLGDHEFEVDATDSRNKAATCTEGGKKVEKCTVCGYTRVVDTKPNYQLHTLGERTWTVTAVPSTLNEVTETQVTSCSTCHDDDIVINALDITAKGTTSNDAYGNKVSDGTRLKLNKNGNYVEYTIDLEGTFEGKMYLYGCVDYWREGSNDNQKKGFYPSTSPSGNAGTNANVVVTIDGVWNEQHEKTAGTEVEILNKDSYEEMGIPDTDTPVANNYSGFGLAEVGAVSLTSGRHTIRYARTGSYNMDITEIHLLGKFTKHIHAYTEITRGTKVAKTSDNCAYEPVTTTCGKAGVALDITSDSEGNFGSALGKKYNKDGQHPSTYVFPVTGAKKASMYFRANVDNAGNQKYSFYTGKVNGSPTTPLPEGATNTTFTMNGKKITLPTTTYGEWGIAGTAETINTEAGAAFFEVAEVNLQDGNNTFVVNCSNSYGLNYWDIMFIY